MRSTTMSLLFVATGFWFAAGFKAGAEPIGTTFTYQGQLKQNGVPADGAADFAFSLHWEPTGGSQPVTLVNNVIVSNGLFTVELDFGQTVFVDQKWLEVAVRMPAGSGSFITLTPRQRLTATPYALQTRGLSVIGGSVGIGTNPQSKLTVAGQIQSTSGGIKFPDDSTQVTAAKWNVSGSNIWYSDGNVGIGTNSPGALLDLTSSATALTGLSLRNTSADQRFLMQVNGSNPGGSGREGNFEIWGSGHNVFTATPQGIVGIGSTSPGSVISGTRLEIGTGHVALANNSGVLSKNSAGNGFGAGFDTWGDDSLDLIAGGVIRVHVTSTGTVGVGTATPGAALDIAGVGRVLGNAWPVTGSGMELAYNPALHRGFVQVLDRDAGTSGDLHLGSGNVTIGTLDFATGGRFAVINNDGQAIEARGTTWAAHFEDTNGTGEAWLAGDDGQGREYGIQAQGAKAGGLFYNTNDEAEARIAYTDPDGLRFGVWASSSGIGSAGYFEQGYGAEASLATSGNIGIRASGSQMGGSFEDHSGTYTYVAHAGAAIRSNGSKHFVQNDPTDPERVILYTALEGDGAATYTRGTAKLIHGEARVPLGETFKWVTNPTIGLTAHLTPRSHALPLAVVSLTTEELVVHGPANAPPEIVFDYFVYGLRIGFEEMRVVEKKAREARIPSMAPHYEGYKEHPELRRFNALERFKVMHAAIGDIDSLDFNEAHALRDAITVHDPEAGGRRAVRSESRSALSNQAGWDDAKTPTGLPLRRRDVTAGDSDTDIEALRARLEQLETIVAELSTIQNGDTR